MSTNRNDTGQILIKSLYVMQLAIKWYFVENSLLNDRSQFDFGLTSLAQWQTFPHIWLLKGIWITLLLILWRSISQVRLGGKNAIKYSSS